jgi:release factor glutamine methyltransferase
MIYTQLQTIHGLLRCCARNDDQQSKPRNDEGTPTANPRLEAELLLAWVLDKPRSYLYAHPEQTLTPEQEARLHALVQRRRQGEPMAYICQQKEFWSLPLWVTPETLIPRPETEQLVEWVLETLPQDASLTVADLGCNGSVGFSFTGG